MTIKLDKFGFANNGEILMLENEFEVVLPEDYKSFLLQENGGRNTAYRYKNLVRIPQVSEEINIDVMFGVSTNVKNGDIKQWNQLLVETAHDAGVITNEEFAIFQNAGYMGLYGGLDVEDIHDRKGLTARQKILDYMGSTELIANLFRISQTEEKLRKDKVEGAEAAINVHYSVGKEVRSAIEKIGGTMPEDLPVPEKSIQQIEKEQMKRLKDKAKKGKLMLDE